MLYNAKQVGREQPLVLGYGCSSFYGDELDLEKLDLSSGVQRMESTYVGLHSVSGMRPFRMASQGAAFLECDKLHTAIHVSNLHTPHVPASHAHSFYMYKNK